MAGLLVVGAAGCGDDVPDGAVAQVGDTVITEKDFNRYYVTTAKSAAQQLGAVPEMSDLPNFTACVTERKGQQPKGQEAAPDRELRKQCEDAHTQVKDQVMSFLIQSQWLVQEAEEQDIEVSDSEVVKTFEEQKKQSFPKPKDYKKFLRESGSSESDILFQLKMQSIQQKLAEKVQKDEGSVSEDDIEEFYEENKERFTKSASRDLSFVHTKTKAKGEAAKKELDDGASFKAVIKKYSINPKGDALGEQRSEVAEGQQASPLDKAVFSAEVGEIEGPVKDQFGWYVFRVETDKPAAEQPLEEVKQAIRSQLSQQSAQEGLQDFITDFQEDFTDKTVCAEGFLVAVCSNGPRVKTDTGPASGSAPDAKPVPPAVPGGAPGAPQGAPPAGAQEAPPQQAAPQQAPPEAAPQQAPQPAP
jgi:foldase protein PrsA